MQASVACCSFWRVVYLKERYTGRSIAGCVTAEDRGQTLLMTCSAVAGAIHSLACIPASIQIAGFDKSPVPICYNEQSWTQQSAAKTIDTYAQCTRQLTMQSMKSVNTQFNYTLCLKKVPTFELSVTSSNLNRFSKILHSWKAYEICYKNHMTLPTSP